MGCCSSKKESWDASFKPTALSSNKCDAMWEEKTGELATFGMSPHFGPASRFGSTPGVIRVRVGFAGGTAGNPNYEDTGDYTIAVQVDFDPGKVKYVQLLDIFWNYHDIFLPSEIPENQSTIFYHSEKQQKTAESEKEKQQSKHEHEIMTQIKPFTTFIDSEDEKQHFVLQSTKDLYKKLEKNLPRSQLAHSHLACRLEGYVSGYGKPEDFDKEIPELYIPPGVADMVRESCVQNQVIEAGADRMNDWG
ncbi:Peptide methionine sulfoxide reductase [Orchesella cincta]|uniref:peptide-methionine (S)-S-oxide reductase n=1 Tax=Orchesella cincta TaxID=48709 RepID=A0A1D2MQD9_ORCCI|nr:Peptide methionine sulfoxide reductase [Orchesella cincta]